MITACLVLNSGIIHYQLDDERIQHLREEGFLNPTEQVVGEIDADEYNDQFPSWEAKSSRRGVNVYRFSGDKRADNVPKRTKEITPRKLKKKQTITYAWVTEESVDIYRIAKKDPRKNFRKNSAEFENLLLAGYQLDMKLKTAKEAEKNMEKELGSSDNDHEMQNYYDREMVNYHEEKERSDRDRILQDIMFKEFDDELHAQLLKESTEAWESSKNNSDYIEKAA